MEDLNNKASRRDARNRWYYIAGLGRVDAIDHRLDTVTRYVSKYIAKGGDIELSESLEDLKHQLALGVS